MRLWVLLVTFAPYLRPHPLLWSPVLRFLLSIYHFSPPQPQFLLSFYLHTSLFPALDPFISSPIHFHCFAYPHPLSFWSVGSLPGSALTLARFSSLDVQSAPPSTSFNKQLRQQTSSFHNTQQQANTTLTRKDGGGAGGVYMRRI